ncbi:MAG: hypothetical protein RRY20_09395 [Bilophila sp.]
MLDYYHFKEINDLFLKGRHEEARHLLTEMQARYIAVCDENNLLKMQITEMEDVLYLAKNLTFDGTCYWLNTGTIRQGPFCQRCYNQDGALLRLDTQNGESVCPVCGTVHERLYPTRSRSLMARPAPHLAKVIPISG